jgi:hypothetical protein
VVRGLPVSHLLLLRTAMAISAIPTGLQAFVSGMLLMLFIAATAFHINEGVALTPTTVRFLLFFATAAGVVVITVDPGDPDAMNRTAGPQDPDHQLTTVLFRIHYGAALFVLPSGGSSPTPMQPVSPRQVPP